MTASAQLKNNKYYIVLNWQDKDKRKQKWIITDLTSRNTKKEVERERIKSLIEWETKIFQAEADKSDVLFSSFIKEWLENTKETISKSTYYSYKQTINFISAWFDKRKISLKNLKPYHIQQFYNEKLSIVSANTIHHYHANIHKALRYAVKMELIEKNPSDKVELPKKNKHIANFYNEEELKTLLKNCIGSEIEIIVLIASWFGLRRGEIIGLRWSAIDFDNKVLSVVGTVKDKGISGSKIANMYYEPTAKNSSSIRSFPMSDWITEYLKNLKQEQKSRQNKSGYNHTWDDFVCVRKNGDLIPLEYVTRAFPKLCEKCNLKRITLHELRHTNISLLLDKGANMKELQEWAGHSSYNTTANIYSHIQTKTKERMTSLLTSTLENPLENPLESNWICKKISRKYGKKQNKKTTENALFSMVLSILVGRGGFEPPKL